MIHSNQKFNFFLSKSKQKNQLKKCFFKKKVFNTKQIIFFSYLKHLEYKLFLFFCQMNNC